jgi:5-methyltetrahydrofolate--homocysteine methyltransferase
MDTPDQSVSSNVEPLLDALYDAVFEGNRDSVIDTVRQLIAAGLAPELILYDAMIPAIQEVGAQFEQGKAFVPEMLVAARAMQGGLDLIKPLLVQGNVQPLARAVIGTVKADIHDIGKNMVAMMWEGAGFEVTDLGVNVPPQKFIDAIERTGAQLVGISALLTTTMTNIPVTIKAFEDAGLRARVKVIIGGAPITAEFAAQVGADGYAADANKAVTVAKSLLGLPA